MTRGSTELFDCARVSDYLESYLSGQVPPPERRGMRLHIHGCAECHRKVMERDPLQFFAPLADQDREATGGQGGDPWVGFYDAIREGIAADEARPRPARRLWLAAAAAVLALVTVGLVAFRLATNPAPPIIVATDTPPPPAAPATPEPGPLPQTVERVRGAGAGEVQIYTMNYYREETGAGDSEAGDSAARDSRETQGRTAELVLIVDARLEL